jgi:hypothetical protein
MPPLWSVVESGGAEAGAFAAGAAATGPHAAMSARAATIRSTTITMNQNCAGAISALRLNAYRAPTSYPELVSRCATAQARSSRSLACDLPAALKLLLTYTMVFWIEFRVSVASSRAISSIALLAILQTIALPTELPRREPHFTQKLEGSCLAK